MTERLYYSDSYLLEFTATVQAQEARGKNTAVALNRTAFYPASGGQPGDTGTLGEAHVLDVEETASGDVVHLLDAPLPPGSVAGHVDWERRFDHMQQHSGQHVLSQAFLRTAGAETASFHLGRETSTIDIALARPSPDQIRTAEALATRIVFEDRPVSVINARPEQLNGLGLRKESSRQGEIRVIDIEAFDRSPCGGTHVISWTSSAATSQPTRRTCPASRRNSSTKGLASKRRLPTSPKICSKSKRWKCSILPIRLLVRSQYAGIMTAGTSRA
jgi:alanyl-tRNA synthetase